MKKELQYESPKIDILTFDKFDVIATSPVTGGSSGWKDDGWQNNTDSEGWL